MIKTKLNVEGLDHEWMQLILEAKSAGVDKEQIREFLKRTNVKDLITENR